MSSTRPGRVRPARLTDLAASARFKAASLIVKARASAVLRSISVARVWSTSVNWDSR